MKSAHLHEVARYRDLFNAAQPFPHVVIDGFLDEELAHAVRQEFPAPEDMPKSRDYIFGDKRELSSVGAQGPASRRLVEYVLGAEFAGFLSEVSGRHLFVDPAFHGGGFHQGGDGSFLDMHVDFNMHPEHADWLRVLNVLIYLNEDWLEQYDGRLVIKRSQEGTGNEIAPLFNRAVIMLTDSDTFHGYRRMSLPPGVTRKSVAIYAYELVTPGSVAARTTGWSAAGAGPVKRIAARYYDPAVRVKNRVFGSSTAKNR